MEYFNLGPDYKKNSLQFRFINLNRINAEDLLKGNHLSSEDLLIEYASGKKEYDLLLCGFSSLFLVSKRFAEVLEENNLSGYLLTNIKIDFPLRSNYYLLSISGKCGPILDELSYQALSGPSIPNAKKSIVWKGLFFNRESHDGSDFFIPDRSQFIFLTEKAKNVIAKSKLENIKMTSTKEIINLNKGIISVG